MKKLNKENVIVVCTIVLCFMLTLSLAMLFNGDIDIIDVFGKDVESDNVYAIVVGGYKDISIARQSAELVKSQGGAGYVISSDDIEIVYAVYSDRDTATNILDSLRDKSAYIKTIKINSSNLKWCDKALKEDVSKALTYYDKAFDILYTIANSLNKNEMTINDAVVRIKVLYTQIDMLKSSFYDLTKENEQNEITEIKVALITALALIDNIKLSNDLALSLSSIRYQLTQLVLCRQALMNVI